MINIPSLTQGQLEILRIAKQYSSRTIQLAYEFPVVDPFEPPKVYPECLQGLIEAGLIRVQSKRLFMTKSSFQQDSWAEYCEDTEADIIWLICELPEIA